MPGAVDMRVMPLGRGIFHVAGRNRQNLGRIAPTLALRRLGHLVIRHEVRRPALVRRHLRQRGRQASSCHGPRDQWSPHCNAAWCVRISAWPFDCSLFPLGSRKVLAPSFNMTGGAVNRNGCSAFQSHEIPPSPPACMASDQTVRRPPYLGWGFLSFVAFCAACSCSTVVCRLARAALSAAISLLAALSRWRASSAFLFELVQKIDVALKAARSLVQPRRFRAVLYPRDILRLRAIELKRRQTDDDKQQAHCCNSQHLVSLHGATACRARPLPRPPWAHPMVRLSKISFQVVFAALGDSLCHHQGSVACRAKAASPAAMAVTVCSAPRSNPCRAAIQTGSL